MALERNFEDPEPYVRDAEPEHPSLIDTRHRVAELYDVDNVPTGIWIDEDLRIVRPNDVVFGRDAFDVATGFHSSDHREALKAWVRDGDATHTLEKNSMGEGRTTPSREKLEARNEYRLAQWLYEHGHEDRATEWYERASEHAPADVTIRRGSMRQRGENPMGWGFIQMYLERWWNGLKYYSPLLTGC